MTGVSLASSVTETVGQVTGSFDAILGWWFVPVLVAIFGASIAIGLILKFFGKGRRRGRRR